MNAKLRKHMIEILQRGEDVPAEFQEDLFPTTKKECELKYAGKEKKEVILNDTMSVPFQAIRHFGEVKDADWANMLISGDNLQALKHLLKLKDEGKLKNSDGSDGVKLIYIDPPFATKQDFRGSKEQKAYHDKIVGKEFLEFLRKRVLFLREILTDDGSIYVHIDQRKGHYFKVLLDEMFNETNFRNEIIYHYDQGARGKNEFGTKHDNIFRYTKTENMVFNTKDILVPFESGMTEWRYSKGGQKGKDMPEGKVPSDVWDIKLNAMSLEHIGYPTQKPEELLERIIKASSNKRDIILDAFAGSGTTGAVAEKLERKWIMIDSSKLAIYTIQKRMFDLKEEIGNKGKGVQLKPFVLYNAGLYHDGELLNKMQENEYKDFVLELFGCQKRVHEINGIEFHGTLNNHSVMIFDKKHYLTKEFIDDLHKNIGKLIKEQIFLIAPVGIVGFNEDYVPKDKVKYTILRIPNSIISYIKEKNFIRLEQPRTADDINQTIDSVGFDFIYPPKVKVAYFKHKGKYCLEIQKFEPIQLGAKIVEFKDAKAEALAMVMIDLDYDGKTFNLGEFYFSDEIIKNDYRITINGEVGDKLMVIYLDIFGNEKKEVVAKKEFTGK